MIVLYIDSAARGACSVSAGNGSGPAARRAHKKSQAAFLRPAMDDLPSHEGLPSQEGRQTAFCYGSLITSQSKPTEAVPAWKDDAETPT